MPKTPDCPYCGKTSELVGGDRIYPHRPDLASKKFYLCSPCNAYVGCHGNTTEPLGRLANATLRAEKMKAHAAFDPLWKSGEMTRSGAYNWLSKTLGICLADCHIGMFSEEECKRVVEAVENRKQS